MTALCPHGYATEADCRECSPARPKAKRRCRADTPAWDCEHAPTRAEWLRARGEG